MLTQNDSATVLTKFERPLRQERYRQEQFGSRSTTEAFDEAHFLNSISRRRGPDELCIAHARWPAQGLHIFEKYTKIVKAEALGFAVKVMCNCRGKTRLYMRSLQWGLQLSRTSRRIRKQDLNFSDYNEFFEAHVVK